MLRTLLLPPGTEFDSSPLFSYSLGYGLNNFERESSPVLNAAAVFVDTIITDVLKKLIDEITVRSMNFDTVKTSADRILRRKSVHFNELLDFGQSQGSRGVISFIGQGNVRWSCLVKPVLLKDIMVCGPPPSP